MKVTTVRFSEDLWQAVAAEAELAGVSASQFIREAALARAASAAGARGEMPLPTWKATLAETRRGQPPGDEELQAALTALSRALARSFRSESRALRAQAEQARRNAEAMLRRAQDQSRFDQRDQLLD